MINPYSKINNARNVIHGTNIDYSVNEQTTINTNNPPKQENEQHWLVRGLATVGNFVSNIVEGAVKSIEGIVDAGAMLVGLFGADVDDFVSYDFTSDIFGTDEEGEGLLDWTWGKALSDISYLEDDSMVNQIAEGVGGMLPAIAVNFIPGVGQALSTAMFIGGAGGNASEQALQEGATYGQALGYGAIAGAIEGATEMIGGRAIGKATELTDTALGKLLIRKGLDKGVSQGVGKLAYTFVSEGLEEVLADVLDVANRRITGVEEDATIDWKQLPKTFLIGGSVGALLDGMQNGASAVRNRDKGGKHFVNVADNLQDIVETNKAVAYLQGNTSISQDKLDKAIVRNTERTINNLESISDELQSMTEEQRSEAFKTLGEYSSFVTDSFNTDGTLKEEVYNEYDSIMQGGAKYNVSSNLIYKNHTLETDIAEINQQSKSNYQLSDSKLNETQRKTFSKLNRNLAKISGKTKSNLELAIIKDYIGADGVKTNGFIDKNRIYITESALENGDWAKTLAHETSHFAIGTKEFNDYAKYIASDDKLLSSAIDNVVANYYDNFNLSVEEGRNLIKRVVNGETKLTEKEVGFYDEVVAHITEELFKNEKSVNAFTKDNTGLARKILAKIKEFLSIFKGTNAKKDVVVSLRKAEILFERALSSYGDEIESFREEVAVALNKKENDNLDKDNEIRYAKKGYSKRDISEVSEKEFNHHYWAIANNLLSKEEIGLLNSSVANIGKGEYYYQNVDGFYMIPVGENGVLNKIVFTDGKHNSYSIDTVIEIDLDNETDLSIERSIIYASERKGVYTKTDGIIQVNYAKDFNFGDFKRKLTENPQYSNGKQDGTRSDRKTSRAIKFSKETIDNKNSGNGVQINEDLEPNLSEKEKSILFNIDNSASYKRIQEQVDGLKPIIIDRKTDYENLENELKKRNGNNPLNIEWALTDDALYIVKDNTVDGFTPVVRIATKTYSKLIIKLLHKIDYNDYNANFLIEEWLDEIFNHPDCLNFFNPDPLYYPGYNVKDSVAITDVSKSLKNQPNYKETDSKGRKLTEAQIEFFKNSKVRDRFGRLQQVYHGTYGEFFVFDKALRGQATKAEDAKLGFFFTNSKKIAEDYSKNAKDAKMLNLIYNVAFGDSNVLEILKNINPEELTIEKAKEMGSEDLASLLEINQDKNTTVFEVFLNIKNPYIENWESKNYEKIDIIRAITKAKLKKCDGVIIRQINDSIRRKIPLSDVYIAFEPNQIKLVTNKNPTKKHDMRFSKKSFSEQVDDVLAGADTTSTHLKVRDTTPKILVDIGLENKPMLITSVHTKTAVNQEVANKNIHTLSVETLKRLPELLESPAIIMDSHKENSIVAFVNAVDTNNNPVMCAINIKGKGNYNNLEIDSNLILSVYGKDTNPIGFIEKAVEEDRVLYWDKKMSRNLFETPGLQLPDNLKKLDSNIIIRKSKWIVNTSQENFAKQIKFSRKVSDGLISKKIADISKKKVYAKKEAQEVINTVIGSINLGKGYYVDVTTKKSIEEVGNELWKVMNTNDAGKRVKISEDIADYLIDTLVIKDMFENEDHSEEINTISAIRPYLHNIDLSTIKDEIKYRFDKDNSVYAIWGARKGEKGKSADQIAMELEEYGIYIKAENQAEIFFEIDRMYRDALKTINKKKVEYLKDKLSEEERQELKTQIAFEIETSFEKYGSKSKFAEILETSNKWKTLYNAEIDRNRAENNLVFEIERLENAKKGAVTDYVDTVFSQSIGLLTRLKFKNSFNRSGARNIIQNLKEWATNPKNLIFKNDDRFNQVILPRMEMIAGNTSIGMSENAMALINKLSKESGLSSIGEIYNWYTKDNIGKDYSFLVKKFLGIYANEKKFSVNEIKALSDIVHYFRNYLEKTKQIRLNDKLIESKDLVEKFVGQIDYNLTRKYAGRQRIFLASMFNQNRKREYYRYFMDGKSIARAMDRYEEGVCTFMMNQLEQGEVTRAITSMTILNDLDNFYKKHKKFAKKVEDKTIKYLNEEIPLGNAMFLYMQLKSEDAITSLMASGFSYTQKNGLRNDVSGFNPELFNDESAVNEQANKLRQELEKQFDVEDKEFISICEDLFNNKLRDLKVKTDEKMLGFSNVIDGYYVPKYMSDASKKIENYDDEIASVSNQSFNKSRIKGAYGRLKIESLPNVIKRHSEGVIKYYSFAEIERNINIIRNLDVGKDEHNVKTVNTEISKLWKSFNNYFEKLYKDIRGVTIKEAYGLLEGVRSGYVKSVLGFNPKVLANQMSSYISAGHILDYKSLAKGWGIKSTKNDIDKYCQLAKYRREENVSAQSQGLINDASSKLLAGIGFVDSFVIKRELSACQVQVEKDTGLKVGTEENKIKAGELLQKVILETQQNSFMTSQTEASRSSNTGLKWLTSFKADAIKSFGRWIDSLGMLLFAKEGGAKSKARNKFIASSGSIMLQALYLATITSLFNKFFNKDDEEDENKVLDFIVDALTNLFGGLPILGDVINSLTSGFDMEDMSYGVINDVIDSTRNVIDLFDGNTDHREVARGVRSVIYSISSVIGIPTKNVYKLIYGTTNLISPQSAYKMDDSFYKQSYSKDLKKAILNEDEEMISVIASLIANENVGYFENSSTRQEINRLVQSEYDVLPQSIASTMTINETQYTLTETQKDDFREVYEKSITAIDKLVSSNGYKIVSDDVKAKAIKYVYGYYYYESQSKTLNVELDNKLFLFGQLIPIDKMALILAEAPTIAEKSTDKKKAVQRYLQSTKLSAIQKYMLMGYFGYKNTNSESAVKSAIDKTSLTKAQKKLLLEKCGY